MAENKILSAPVIDSEKGHLGFVGTRPRVATTYFERNDNHFIILDTLDIVRYIVKGCGSCDEIRSRTVSELTGFGDDPVSKITGLSDRDPFEPLEETTPANALVELFALGIHRLPIVKQGEIVQIISQSTFCKHLLDNSTPWKEVDELFGVRGGGRSRNLGEKLAFVKRTDTVLEVLKKIDESLVSSVPVVDESGAIVASFSAADLRGVFGNALASLTLPVEEYLRKHSPQAFSPLVGSADETAGSLVKKMLNATPHRRHRVWILGASGKKPVGVFSMTDAIKLIRDAGSI